MVAHTCNPNILGGQGGGGLLEASSSRSARVTVRPCLQKKIKISQVWWYAPIFSATQEAQMGESLEPKSSRPPWETWQKPCLYQKYKN